MKNSSLYYKLAYFQRIKFELSDTISGLRTKKNSILQGTIFQMKSKTKAEVQQLRYKYRSKQRRPNENACI